MQSYKDNNTVEIRDEKSLEYDLSGNLIPDKS